MTDTLPALRKTLRTALPPESAFDLFTRGLAGWWPVESHSLSGREGHLPQQIHFEPRAGGRITERRHDGTECDWAEVIDWQPPARLELAWHVGRARADATRIELWFDAAPQGGSEITLIHSGFEVLGPAGEAAAANYDEGWDLVLGERFRQACEARAGN